MGFVEGSCGWLVGDPLGRATHYAIPRVAAFGKQWRVFLMTELGKSQQHGIGIGGDVGS